MHRFSREAPRCSLDSPRSSVRTPSFTASHLATYGSRCAHSHCFNVWVRSGNGVAPRGALRRLRSAARLPRYGTVLDAGRARVCRPPQECVFSSSPTWSEPSPFRAVRRELSCGVNSNFVFAPPIHRPNHHAMPRDALRCRGCLSLRVQSTTTHPLERMSTSRLATCATRSRIGRCGR